MCVQLSLLWLNQKDFWSLYLFLEVIFITHVLKFWSFLSCFCVWKTVCWGPFWKPKWEEEAQQHEHKGVGKWIENSLSSSSRNNGSQAHEINKWVLKREMGLKELEKREKANHGQYMMWKSENGSRQAQSNESKRIMVSPWVSRMRDDVIGSGKPKEFSKNPWEYKVKKRAGKAQGKPKESKWA